MHAKRLHILTAAFALAARSGVGVRGASRGKIAREAECPPSLVSHHWGSMSALRAAIMQRAVDEECLPLIAEGLLDGYPSALLAPQTLKDRALASLTK